MGKFDVKYLELPSGKKLISYHNHDYKSKLIGTDFYMVDGGQDGDYFRFSAPKVPYTIIRKVLHYLRIKRFNPFPQVQTCDISECFSQVREEFKWGSNYSKEGDLLEETIYRSLKDLDDEHLEILISDFTTGFIKNIMIEEQLFRTKVKEYIKLN